MLLTLRRQSVALTLAKCCGYNYGLWFMIMRLYVFPVCLYK